jgi:hypothetical protein
MSTIVVSVKAGPIARRFSSADPNEALTSELRRNTIPALVHLYRGVAPFRSGRMRRNIGSRAGGRVVQVVSVARSEEGFAYTGVTRFGHRAGRIYPRKAKALAFKIGGRTIIRSSVAGYHPAHDWAQDALPGAVEILHSAGGRIGRKLVGQLT